MHAGFVFLASPRPQHGLGRWMVARHPSRIVTSWEELDSLGETPGLVVGYVGYTAYRHTLDLPAPEPPLEFPEIWLGVFEEFWVGSPEEGFRHSSGKPETPPLPRIAPGILTFETLHESFPTYRRKIQALRGHLRKGDIYQANYTVSSTWRLEGSPWGVFHSLLDRQPTAFAAYLQITPHQAVLSFSPELFFHLRGDHVRTVPMKGTRPRGRTPEEDEKLREDLRHAEKDRAENVMIVDLLRNDLGKIAVPGGVSAPTLFAVESFPTVHQMISVVEAELRPDAASLAQTFHALFPGGSVTGAPKKRAVEILRDLEGWVRGVYTGAIGVVYPWEEAVFSIAIRTLQVAGTTALYGAGGGIVLDSSPEAEWEELLAKMAFLKS